MISVSINGASHTFDQPISVADLIRHLNLVGKRVAIECNREIIPRGRFEQYFLNNGDQIEVVIAVGGG